MKRFSLISIVAVLAGLVIAPASADAHPALGRQVLPPNDGWAAEGTGTTGGSAALALTHELRAAGVPVNWRRFALTGLVTTVVVLAAATGALLLTS